MTAVDEKLAGINQVLDAALDQRVRLHSDRLADRTTATQYLAGLRAVREVENALEPERRRLGAAQSRAYELAQAELVEATHA